LQQTPEIKAEDMLIIEDLHLLGHCHAGEEIFFNLFNAFLLAQQKIVLTSQLLPAEHTGLHPRITSRFASGMVTILGLLDELTCGEIIRKCADDRGVNFPDKVVQYLITRVPRNPAYLQSIFDEIDRLALQLKRPITINLVKSLISE